MKNLIKLLSLLSVAGFMLVSCEGPAGPAGNGTCKDCHNSSVVEAKSVEFEFSKHTYGEAAFTEAGNTGCSPCHASEAFKYVCKNNIPVTFTLNATTGKYSNDYATADANALGEFNCTTCHSSLHSTYESTDFYPLTTTKAVDMTMWKGTKTINLTQDDSKANLCVKCHQPRPLTTSTTTSDGNVVDYAALANPSTLNSLFYDATVGNAAPNKVIPSYRTHVHYGTIGAIFAGKGGIEFTGSLSYSNSSHTTVASCQDCHMATVYQRAGGHTFKVRNGDGALASTTTFNFNGCNVAGCHSGISTSDATHWTSPRTDIKNLLNSLSAKINSVGGTTAILHAEPDGTLNLWAGITTGNWDGYLNIYDPSTNAAGVWRNPAPSNSWTTAQKATNTALPVFPSLKNAVMGSIINFQMCLREYSSGIHNYKYAKALLQNSIEAMATAGY